MGTRFAYGWALRIPTLLALWGCQQEFAIEKKFKPWNYSQNPAVYIAGNQIAENYPSLKGISYSISPQLVEGLSFDSSSGVISGVPTQLSGPTSYEVTLKNSAGVTQTIITLASVDGKSPEITSFVIPSSSSSFLVNINEFRVNDDFGVEAYCVTTSNSPAGCSWNNTPPTRTSFVGALSPGQAAVATFYAFAKDRAGNVSQGKAASISIEMPIIGLCGSAHGVATAQSPSTNLCLAGNPTSVLGSTSGDAPWRWNCNGTGDSTTNVNCAAPLLGYCGSANGTHASAKPASGLCAAGVSSTVLGTGPWTWSCNGSNSFSAACGTAEPAVSGVCGAANAGSSSSAPTTNLCSKGTSTAVSGSGPWTWACMGSYGGSNSSCSANPPAVNGVCGSANGVNTPSVPTTNLCAKGISTAVSGSGPWNWSCQGEYGGATASCSAQIGCPNPQSIYAVVRADSLEINIPEVLQTSANLCVAPSVLNDLPHPTGGTSAVELLFVIDSTGSMAGEIAEVRRNLNMLAAQLKSLVPTVRIGVASFRDTDIGSQYAYRVDQPLTTNLSLVNNALIAMPAYGGGDEPEIMIEALYQAVTGQGLTLGSSVLSIPATSPGWTAGSSVSKHIVLVSDAGTKTIPSGGHTQQQAISALNAAGIKVVGLAGSRSVTDQAIFAQATDSLAKARILEVLVNQPMVFGMNSYGTLNGSGGIDALAIALSGAVAQSFSFILHFNLAGATSRFNPAQPGDVYMTQLTTTEACTGISIVTAPTPRCDVYSQINVYLEETTVPRSLNAGAHVTIR